MPVEARADVRPYIVRMYDRWIILAIILLIAWSWPARMIFAYAIYFRGDTFEKMLVLPAAEHYYKKSIAVYDKIPVGWRGLGELYFMQAPRSRVFYDKTVDTFQRGFALNPGSYILAFDLGRTYFLGKDYRSALDAFQRAVKIAPTDREALDYAAWSAFHAGNRSLAFAYWHHIIALYPRDDTVRYILRELGG